MIDFRDYQRRTTPPGGEIKRKAHTATLAACALIIPSGCAVYYRSAGLKENEPYWVQAAETLWAVHAAVTVLALLLWIFETPRKTRYLPSEDGAVSNALGEIHPLLPLVGYALLAVLFGWLTAGRIEMAHTAWQWERYGAVFWHTLQALLLLVFTLGFGLLPVLGTFEFIRKLFQGKRKA